jgi:transmembrane 9 superfamily protein 2/4
MYFYTQLEITNPVATMIYFGYMAVAALVFFLVTGTVGFYSSWQFVWTIYSAVKVD